jgi:tetratricopeptide (TPR) repeat protein
LSLASNYQGRLDDCARYAERSLDVCAQEGLLAEEAAACLDIVAYLERIDPDRALPYAYRALELSRQCGHTRSEADALNAIAMCSNHSGDYAAALRTGELAIAMLREMDSPYGVAAASATVGLAHHRLGRLSEAIDAFEESIALYRKVDRPLYVADNLVSVGDIYRDAGQLDEAGRAWLEALAIYRDLGQVDEELVDRIRRLSMGVGQP